MEIAGVNGKMEREDPPPVITRMRGGMGGQMFQYAMGRALAARLGRPLVVDARMLLLDDPPRQFALQPFNLRCSYLGGYAGWIVRWLGSRRMGKHFRTAWIPSRSYDYRIDPESGYDASIWRDHPGPIVLQGYWQSYRYLSGIEADLRKELAFTSPPAAQNAALIREIGSCNSVAVHVRRTDFVSNTFFGACTPDYYARGTDYIASRVDSPRFFVFSDEPDWARANLDFPGQWQVVDHNLGKRDHEDMRLMTHCKHLLLANSTFSWWAGFLAHNPDKIIVVPHRWFNGRDTPMSDRVPPPWVQLDAELVDR